MDIKKAFEIRAEMVKKYGKYSKEVSVMGRILDGGYEPYKDNGFDVATDDLKFLKEDK